MATGDRPSVAPAGPRRRPVSYLLLCFFALLFLTPLVWMVSVSLKAPEEILSPDVLPHRPQLSAYRDLIRSEHFDFLLYARNTLIILVLSLPGVLISCSIAAYGFARIRFRGRGVMFAVCLATMMVPFPVIMVPSYMIFSHLDWIGTYKPLWIPAWFGNAFSIFLLRQFFLGIPQDLEESATLDGCSRWACFWRIILPLSTPALAVVALFHCLAVWNDLVGPLVYLTHQEQFTLALGLQTLQNRAGDTPWNQMMAASVMIILPVLLLFLLAQRTFIRGITTTGMKG